MHQLTFDYEIPIARTIDPPTSQIAAKQVDATTRRLQFVEALKRIGKPSTAQEIAAMVDSASRESVRKRAKECVDLGLVLAIGIKTCGVTGKLATAYADSKCQSTKI